MDVIKTKLQTQNCFGINDLCPHCNLKNCSLKHNEHNNVNKVDINTLRKEKKPLFIPNLIARYFVSNNTQSKGSYHSNNQRQKVIYKDIFSTIKSILQEEGLRGFTKGAIPRIMSQAPSAAISWSTYEIIKRYLTKNNRF